MARSKYECYNMLLFGLKVYLPDYKCCPMSFLKQLLIGTKVITYKTGVNLVDVPHWQEFKIENVYKFAKQDTRFSKYLPDYVCEKKHRFDREYIFNIIETYEPGYISDKVDE